MKKGFYLLILLFVVNACYATHIVGGEVYYTYLGAGAVAGTSQYKVSLRLFRDCDVACGVNGVACLPNQTLVSVYENGNGYTRTSYLTLPLEDDQRLTLTDYPLCIVNKPSVCYEVKTYSTTITLKDNDVGYILAYQNCCRATTLNVLNDNPYSNQGLPGVTYDCSIPGKNLLPDGHNSTAVFNLKKPDLICYNSPFTLDYGATDPDATDSVSFAFEPAYTSGELFFGANDQQPAAAPPYTEVDYNTTRRFFGTRPLGDQVDINPVTGQIHGISPAAGLYVVSVVVFEWRKGVNIARHRKDFILRIESCSVPKAALNASYVTCNGFDLTFTNESTASNITSYYWNFGDDNTEADTSVAPVASYTFPKAGTYKVTLITNKGSECADTALTKANVFPGFAANFNVLGSCYQNPFTFKDASTSIFGIVNSWRWDFGDLTTTADTSLMQNPDPYKYSNTGTVNAQLIVGNSEGCLDTINKEVVIIDKPVVTLPFHDTVICSKDNLQLIASTDMAAVYSWTPLININNSNTANPIVSPKTTTTYFVKVDAGNSCVNNDSVKVNVIDQVSVLLPKDTTICLTDTVQFHPLTNGLQFKWTPAATFISSDTAKEPFAIPTAATTYRLLSKVGSCVASGDITVHTAPYPTADAGTGVAVCYGDAAQLNATYSGNLFAWSPVNTLINANTLTPVARPLQTTLYTFTARDTSAAGCPKPTIDTVTVLVVPKVQVFAGRDTNIVVGQPLQLQATGAETYSWSPGTYMSDVAITNPVVNLPASVSQITYTVSGTNAAGCSGKDSITVYQYKTLPQIFVPSAFTPNNDGQNDILKPLVAGMKRFENFSVYNRWGQLLFSTSIIGQGWDGMYKGMPQPQGTYVYMATAVDYLDKPVVRKGTIVLIR